MRALGAALVPLVPLMLLVTPAEALTLQQAVDWGHCRLYPSHARCRPPAPPAEPVQAPVAAPPPAPPIIPPSPQVAPVVVPAKPVKAKPRVKSKPKLHEAKKARKRLVGKGRGTWWCRLTPAGTTIEDMQAEAKSRKIAWTPQRAADAQDCLNSK